MNVCQSATRWVRIRVKILCLAYRVRQHTKAVRAFKVKLEAHMANPQRMHDEERKTLTAQLKQMQEKDAMLRGAAQTVMTGWKVLGE